MTSGTKTLIAVGTGAGGAQVGTLTAKYLLPAEYKKYAAAVGLGTGLIAAALLAISKKWRGEAIVAGVAAILTSGPRVAEALFLPKPEGGHDLGVVTIDELRAVMVQELKGNQNGGINPVLSAAFGYTPLSGRG